MILARNCVTLSQIRDIEAVYRFYKLQSSTASPPAKPTTSNIPPSGWSMTEPSYTAGSTNSLYTVELTIFTDDTFSYSDVSLSSSYEAAKQAYNKAAAAQSALDDYINPIASKSWTGIVAVANNDPNGWLYWGFVRPASYYTPWRIRYQIRAKINGITDGYQVSTVMIDGQKNTFYAYQTYNVIPNTSYRPLCAHVLYTCKEAGITNGYGHLLGTRLQSSYDPVTASHARAVDIDVLEAENCTFEFADTWFLYANAPGTGSTNYNARTAFDGTTNGFTESGDRNETNHVLNNFCGKTGALGIWQTGLFMEDGNGTYQNICTDANGTITRTNANTKKPNPNGFKVGSEIYFPRDGSHTAANTNITTTIWTGYGAFDSRYSLNTTLTANCLTPYKQVYLVGEILSDGLFYLDNPWWTQTPNDPSKVYVHVGMCYDSTTSNCRITLTMPNKWYKYVDGKLVDYSNRLAELAQVTADSKAKVIYSSSMPAGSDFNEYDVWFNTSASGGNRMYYWNGSAWTEKKFSTGAIADNAITASLIAADAVTAEKILARSITASHIAAGTITANEIKGNTITVAQLTTENLAGQNGWINLTSGTFNYGNGLLSWDGTTLSVTGEINATSGKFGGTNGFTVGAGKLYSGTHSAYNTAEAGVYIGTDYISLGSGGVTYLKNDGTGKLGAWLFDATKLYNGTYGSDGSLFLSTSNMSSKAIGGRTGADWRLTVGSKFGVTGTGAVYCSSLTATNVDLSGKVTANSGNLAGWNVVRNDANRGTSSAGGHIYNSGLYAHASDSEYEYEIGMKNDGGNSTLAFYVKRIPLNAEWNGTNSANLFYVSTGGKLYCSNAELAGKITASSGAIGGWNILANRLEQDDVAGGGYRSGMQSLTGGSSAAFYAGCTTTAGNAIVGNSAFYVTQGGKIYCSNLEVDNPTFKVTSTYLEFGDIAGTRYFSLTKDNAFLYDNQGHSTSMSAQWFLVDDGGGSTKLTSSKLDFLHLSVSQGSIRYNSGTDYFGMYSDAQAQWIIGMSTSDNIWIGPTSTASLPNRIILGDTIDKIYVFNSSGSTVKLSTAVSDRRLKHDIRDLARAHEFIMGLAPKKYKLNGEEEDRYHFGFVAQEVRPLLERTVGDGILIAYNPSGEETNFYDPVDESTFEYSMDYTQFIAPMVSVIQEQERKIRMLTEDLSEVREMLAALLEQSV